MRIAWVLLLAVTPAIAHAGTTRRAAETPSGPVVLVKSWEPTDSEADLLRSHVGDYLGRAFRVAAEHLVSHTWLVFAAEWDSGGSWPRGQTIAVTTRRGETREAAIVMAMSPIPVCNPFPLGLYDRRLDPHELEAVHSGHGIALLVGIPGAGLDLGDITDVQVRQRSPSAAPAPAVGGAR